MRALRAAFSTTILVGWPVIAEAIHPDAAGIISALRSCHATPGCQVGIQWQRLETAALFVAAVVSLLLILSFVGYLVGWARARISGKEKTHRQ